MDLVRLATVGSVDDGKSTLIGRLLYDSKQIFQDQLEAVEETSARRGSDFVDLALLTDGLRAEREQGITIDVAYRYFATPKRKFILADTPGHTQYTRNMVTGASMANVAVVLIDARKGVLEQTRRHSFVSSLLGVPHMIVCINKMDLVDYDESVYEAVRSDFETFAAKLRVHDIRFVPMSALKGENVVEESRAMPWYTGRSFLHTLEEMHIASDRNLVDRRFPVQYVIRPQRDGFHDFRGYAGQVAGGIFKPGDEIVVLPSGFTSTIRSIATADGPIDEAFPPMSVVIELDDDIDISRGDMICRPTNQPIVGQDIQAMICWMSDRSALESGRTYVLKHTTRRVRALVKDLLYRVDINSLHRASDAASLRLNEIGRVGLRTTQPLFFDRYTDNRGTGSFVLIEEGTNETVAAGMILSETRA
jgi:bifunctional enzyme CysN/CysC